MDELDRKEIEMIQQKESIDYQPDNKPRYKYERPLLPVVVGQPAFLFNTDHPNCKTKEVRTSPVVSYDKFTGHIETLNSHYSLDWAAVYPSAAQFTE